MIAIGSTVLSPAKINWTLRVLGRREDGFHEIESLVSTVTLYDELAFSGLANVGFELECDWPDVPQDRQNLIWRAAEVFASHAGCELRWACRLAKRIPLGGGLGGGSSNAAATLVALNRLSGRDWPVERLAPLAADLGSDVPLFLYGRTAVVSGRGERVLPAELGWRGWVVLLMPGIGVPTAEVYRAWRPETGTEVPRTVHPAAGGGAVRWMERTFNMLERPAFAVCPRLEELMREAARLAGRTVRLSGSGSTFFTAFDREAEARAFADRARTGLSVRAEVVQPVA